MPLPWWTSLPYLVEPDASQVKNDYLPVQNQDLPTGLRVVCEADLCGNGDIVEDTKTHWPITLSMMSRRSYYGDSVLDETTSDCPGCLDCTSCRKLCACKSLLAEIDRVATEPEFNKILGSVCLSFVSAISESCRLYKVGLTRSLAHQRPVSNIVHQLYLTLVYIANLYLHQWPCDSRHISKKISYSLINDETCHAKLSIDFVNSLRVLGMVVSSIGGRLELCMISHPHIIAITGRKFGEIRCYWITLFQTQVG